MILNIILIILEIIVIFVNRELRKQLEKVREINRDLRRSERTFKGVLDRINFKAKSAYKCNVWNDSHKALKEIENMSEYKNKALDSDYQSKI